MPVMVCQTLVVLVVCLTPLMVSWTVSNAAMQWWIEQRRSGVSGVEVVAICAAQADASYCSISTALSTSWKWDYKHNFRPAVSNSALLTPCIYHALGLCGRRNLFGRLSILFGDSGSIGVLSHCGIPRRAKNYGLW